MTKADTIKETVAEFFGVPVAAIEGPCRKTRIARARLTAYLMFREFTDYSYPRIATQMDRDDHTTIISGERSIKEHVKRDEDLAARVEAIREALRNTFDPIPFVRRSQVVPEFKTRRAA